MNCDDTEICILDNKYYYENIIKCLSSDKADRETYTKEDSWIHVQAANYLLLNGTLYYDKRKPRKVITNENIQNEILQKIHIDGGTHIGVKKMHEQLKKSYFWRYCYKSISQYVQNCPTCSLNGHQETRIQCSQSKLPSSPWTNIELYILCPEMRDNLEMMHLAILFDPVSCWVSASAMIPDSSNVAEFMFGNMTEHGFFSCCTLYDVSQPQYEEILSEFGKLTGEISTMPHEIKIVKSNASLASNNDSLKSIIDVYLKEHPNDWWRRSTLLLWLWNIRNTNMSGRSPMEIMNFTREHKFGSFAKPVKARADNSAVVGKQSSEGAVNLNIHDTASTSKILKHPNDTRRSIRQAQQRITVNNESANSVSQHLLLTGSTIDAVKEFVSKSKEQKSERKKRGEYHRYTPEVRDSIAKHAIENGIRDASKNYSTSLGFPVSSSTVRNFVRSYHAFSAQTKEEIGRYATECGVESARKHYTEKLGKPISAAFIRKFRRLYLRVARNSQVSRSTGSTGRVKAVRNLYCTSVREEIGKYASAHGVQATVRHFSEKLQFKVKESTVRKYKKLYARSSDVSADANQQQRALPTISQTVESSSQNAFHSQIPEQNYYVQNYSHYPAPQYGCHSTANYSICATQPYSLNQPVPPYPSFTALPPPPQYQPSSAQLPAYSRHWNATLGAHENSSEANPTPSAVVPDNVCGGDTSTPSTSSAPRRKDTTNASTSSPAKEGREVKKLANRGRYASYSPEIRLQIGQFAAAHGCVEAIAYFKQKLGHEIPESTIRTLRDKFIHHTRNCDVDSINKDSSQETQRGRPYRLGAYDATVQECLRQLKRSGEPVNVLVTIATARQVLLEKEPTLLEENGGPIKLTKYWAKSFLRRAGINKQADAVNLPAGVNAC